MAEIQPFRAFRYDLGRVGKLSDVIAPPYDVIDDAFRNRLAAQHTNNVVNIDLPVGEDRYARAGRLFKDWMRDGILKQDSARGFYVYHQDFEVDGVRHARRGFLARIRLEPFDKGIIQPHEETFAGPKLDRLRLMEATQANLSPVFGLYADDKQEIQNLLDDAIGRQPPFEAADHLGVLGRIWPVTDQNLLSRICGLIGPKVILIADGHHRYETALEFRNQQLGAAAQMPGDEPSRFALMMLVGMSDPGLLVLETHRLLRGCGTMSADVITKKLAGHFDVSVIGTGDAAGRQAWDQLHIEVGQGGLAFGVLDGRWLLAKPRDLAIMNDLAPEHTSEWRRLSVSVLHKLVLDKLLGPFEKNFAIDYVHLLDEALTALREKTCELAVLVPSASVADVATLAGQGERMPQKSTYFYPKLQTGFVFNPLFTN